MLRVAWGQLADMSSKEWAGLGSSSHPAGKMPHCLQEGYGHSQATQQPHLARLPRAQHPPHLAPPGSSFLAPPLSGSSCACSISHSHAHPLTAPTSPAPILSLTTFDAGSDYFCKCHQASHKTQTLGTSLVGLIRIDRSTQGTWIRSLVGELRFHICRTSKPTQALGNEEPMCPN